MSYMSFKLRDMANQIDHGLRPNEADRAILREVADLLDGRNLSEISLLVLRDREALTVGLRMLDNGEIGKVIGSTLGVMAKRGVDLNNFLPSLAEMVLTDDDIAERLEMLGEQ